MSDVIDILKVRFAAAFEKALGAEFPQVPGIADTDPLLRASANPKFGDYQANAAMGLAKKLGQKPRDLAQKIMDQLEVDDLCSKVEIAGPGFINLHLADAFLADQTKAMADDGRLGVAAADPAQTVVVDYSSPNVAKEMHVGHLRSTIIGDAIARVLESMGHKVIRQNHLGDWGTQFGMLITNLIDRGIAGDVGSAGSGVVSGLAIDNLEEFYREAKKRFDSDADFAERSRQAVVDLQGGNERSRALWTYLIEQSKRHFEDAYARLNVQLTDADIRGESSYNDMLAPVVDDLEAGGHLTISDGAAVVYPQGFKDREGEPMPMIVRKSDGGYLYATTDLAAARYRMNELHADRVIYVTDARQGQHFAMLFQVLKQVGWASDQVRLEHVAFGMVLGKDKKPYKTRDGGTVKLSLLLDEAIKRSRQAIDQKNPDMSVEQRDDIAAKVGIGALKYADLSSDRIKDYVFDWDRMLALDGNTAPYLQYSYVRIRSIFRKAVKAGFISELGIEGGAGSIVRGVKRAIGRALGHRPGPVAHSEPAERALCLKLLQYASVVQSVADSLEPHRLCTYLYELASLFHSFFENCPVLRAENDEMRDSRLRLCDLTARTLHDGLGLLGIETVERM